MTDSPDGTKVRFKINFGPAKAKLDPYFGFQILEKHKGRDLEIYRKIHEKGFTCLTQYEAYNVMMKVLCPKGHENSGPSLKLIIPCNNCKTCWDERNLTHYERLEEVVFSRNGKIIGEYVDTRAKIELRCEEGHNFSIIPNSVTSVGGWCSRCNGSSPLQAREKFEAEVKRRGGKIIGEYLNNYTKIELECKEEHRFFIKPSHVTCDGGWCSKCNNLCPIQAKEKFEAEVKRKGGKIIGEYINSYTKVELGCEKNHHFYTTPIHITCHKTWCPKCNNVCPIQGREKFETEVKLKRGKVIGEYINTQTKIEIECENGHRFCTTPVHITSHKTWCWICKGKSRGEREMRLYCESRNMTHEGQVKFFWLPTRLYDRVITIKDRKVIFEFDGKQHFKNGYYHRYDEEIFEGRRYIDILKTKKALENGISIVRLGKPIPRDVPKIMDEMLSKLEKHFDEGGGAIFLTTDDGLYKWIFDGIKDISDHGDISDIEDISDDEDISDGWKED